MIGGLGSGFFQLEPDKDKVVLSQTIEENKRDDLMQTGFDMNDDPLVPSLKDVEIEEKGETDECREDVEVGNLKVGDLNETDKNKGWGEGNRDNNDNVSVNKKVRKEPLEGKGQYSGRVLRSMSVQKNRNENDSDNGESGGDKTEFSNSCENKTVQVDKEEGDRSYAEAKEAERKPGRSEMNCSDGDEKKEHSVEGGQSISSGTGIEGKAVKRKRGRPFKFQGNDGCKKKTDELQVGENNYTDGEVRKQFKRKRGRPPKVLGNGGVEKKVVRVGAVENGHLDGDISKESKRKRGRPPKVQGDSGFENSTAELKAVGSNWPDDSGTKKSKARESYYSDVRTREETNPNNGIPPTMHQFRGGLMKEVKRKRGRPPKVLECVNHKRGRPPNLLGSKKALTGKVIYGRKKSDGLTRGIKNLKGSVNFHVPANTSYSEKRSIGKESSAETSVSASEVRNDDVKKNDDKALKMLNPKTVNLEDQEKMVNKAGDKVELKRREAKQALRDRIVKLLIAAGWTIDYRPRNNREYNDAVYVNPEGKTHWSITLAYRMLKKYYESGDSGPKVGPNGFIFTPIPEEELSILTRVIRKKRVGKKKPTGEVDDTSNDEEVENKMNKRKKKLKSNEDVKKRKRQKLLKAKRMLHKEKNFDGILPRGTQVSGKRRKLQQTQNGKRYALLVRSSVDGAESDNNGYVLYDGKRTVLAWMIELDAAPLDGKVEYRIQRRTRTRESKSGRIMRNGIQCDCCSEVFTVAEFETHAGSKLQRPFQNICLETGVPLLQCLLDAWNKQPESKCKGFHVVNFGGEDPNDDTCGICGDGGDLICCDSCPSTFHQSCLDIKAFPPGKWNCVYCTCKYCGMVGNSYQREKDDDAYTTVFTCQLCEEKYHKPCIQPMDAFDDDSSGEAFCGKRCKELFERLQMLVGVKHELPEGFSWTFLRRFDISSDVCVDEAYQKIESNSKLAVALSVMDECFLPLVDHKSGINLIHNIVYNFGSNFTRLNYSGFLTAILERGDEIVCAASIRIHGNQLAEMPFIGTRYAYRRQGMCRRLLCAVESALSSLNVEKLVIPAVSELRETWTSVFGFQPLETESRKKMRNMNMLVFPGVDMLQKPVLAHVIEDQMMGEGPKKSGENCRAVFDLNVSAESPVPQTDEIIDEAVESMPLHSDGNLKHASNITGETINIPAHTLSCSLIPAAEERKLNYDSQLSIPSEEKIDETLVKENFDSSHEGSAENSNDIVCTKNKVSLVHVTKDDNKLVVINGFDGTIQMSNDVQDIKHHENLEVQVAKCVSDLDKTVQLTEKVKNCHAVATDMPNQTSLLILSSAQDVANGHYVAASNANNSSSSEQGEIIGASVEVLAPVDENLHTSYDGCSDTSKKQNLQLCLHMSTKVGSADVPPDQQSMTREKHQLQHSDLS